MLGTALPIVLCSGVLWLADVAFERVRLDQGSLCQRWLTLAVLAAIMVALTSMVDLWGPGMAVVLVGVVGLLLWLVTWLSTWLDLSFKVTGVVPFALTAAGLSLATWPVRLARRSTNPSAAPAPFLADPFVQPPMGPFR